MEFITSVFNVSEKVKYYTMYYVSQYQSRDTFYHQFCYFFGLVAVYRYHLHCNRNLLILHEQYWVGNHSFVPRQYGLVQRIERFFLITVNTHNSFANIVYLVDRIYPFRIWLGSIWPRPIKPHIILPKLALYDLNLLVSSNYRLGQ